jgi:SAM-dependent methyltransferase
LVFSGKDAILAKLIVSMEEIQAGIGNKRPDDWANIETYIETIARDTSLYEEKSFEERIEAIDFLGFQVIGQIEDHLRSAGQPEAFKLLKHRAEKVKDELEKIDTALFQKLQTAIRMEGCAGQAFRKLVTEFVDIEAGPDEGQEEIGYDNLDIFLNTLFHLYPMPEQTKDLEPEMVFYQKTPARIIFELVERLDFTREDVFFDLGSGLGQVAILVNLLAGIKAKGVEFEPAFCDYARDCATELNLPNVSFINVDARKADYSDGTIFFLYTPFRGGMLQAVLAVLQQASLRREIKVLTYGPCTAQVALESWLHSTSPVNDHEYKLRVFTNG